eukprot:m.90809 g.90809  ORF g.90809 m.90809 type:complete len:867 (+) comp9880_c0_seq2:236-2836(+)
MSVGPAAPEHTLHICGVAGAQFDTLCAQVDYHQLLPTFEGWAVQKNALPTREAFDAWASGPTGFYAQHEVPGPHPRPPIAWMEHTGNSETWQFLGGQRELAVFLEDTSRIPLLTTVRGENATSNVVVVDIWWGDESKASMVIPPRGHTEVVGNLNVDLCTLSVTFAAGQPAVAFKLADTDVATPGIGAIRDQVRASIVSAGSDVSGRLSMPADMRHESCASPQSMAAASLRHADEVNNLSRLELIQRLRRMGADPHELHDQAVSIRIAPPSDQGSSSSNVASLFVGKDETPRAVAPVDTGPIAADVNIAPSSTTATRVSSAAGSTSIREFVPRGGAADGLNGGGGAGAGETHEGPTAGVAAGVGTGAGVDGHEEARRDNGSGGSDKDRQKVGVTDSKMGDPRCLAARLYHHEGFTHRDISAIISKRGDYSANVLREFMEHYNFKGMTIVQAMRTLLARFNLDGEGWAIDNIMSGFAKRYVEEVPRAGLTADDAHMLATAIIMLNMDMYNPKVMHIGGKMSRDVFVRNLEGLKGKTDEATPGSDFPKEMLEGIYMDVYRAEIVQAGLSVVSKQPPAMDRSHMHAYTLQKRTAAKERVFDYIFSRDVAPLGQCELSNIVHMSIHEVDKKAKLQRSYGPKPLRMSLVGSRIVWHARHVKFDTSDSQQCIRKIAECLLARHVYASMDSSSGSHYSFSIVHADGREWHVKIPHENQAREWVMRINYLAAQETPPPLSRPVEHTTAKARNQKDYMLPVYPLCAALADESIDDKLEWQEALLCRYVGRLRTLSSTMTEFSAQRVMGGCCGGRVRQVAVPRRVLQELAHCRREIRRLHTYVRLLKDGGMNPDESPGSPHFEGSAGRVSHTVMSV